LDGTWLRWCLAAVRVFIRCTSFWVGLRICMRLSRISLAASVVWVDDDVSIHVRNQTTNR
jgi:hypothetical protein